MVGIVNALLRCSRGVLATTSRHRQRGLKLSLLPYYYCSCLCCSVVAVAVVRGFSATSTKATTTTTASTMLFPSQSVPYVPPNWCADRLLNVPKHGRLVLGNLPTPMYRIPLANAAAKNAQKQPTATTSSSSSSAGDSNGPPVGASTSCLQRLHELDVTLLVKRDDCTGGPELGGNKIRKLEFLLAEALAENYDSVVTIGGVQSNHCRATAAACRMVQLEPHLILRTSRAEEAAGDLGTVGNLLMDRMVGSSIYTCTAGEYGRFGSNELIRRLRSHLEESEGKKVYPIPVGGSNGVGTWGYINAVDEVVTQLSPQSSTATSQNTGIDHIVFACGSGGTAAGICLGIALAYAARQLKAPTVHAIGVCDTPDYFYGYIADIADEMGFVLPDGYASTEQFVRRHMVVHQGKGLGYARSTPEELEFVSSFARETGIVLDPVYSGKALYRFLKDELEPDDDAGGSSSYRGSTILFWHTGGALGLYEKSDDLSSDLSATSPCRRLDLYGKGVGLDLSGAPESD